MTRQKKEIPWAKLSKEEKISRLSELWVQGLSDDKIAAILSATKGQVVGFRHTHTKLTAKNRGATAPLSGELIPSQIDSTRLGELVLVPEKNPESERPTQPASAPVVEPLQPEPETAFTESVVPLAVIEPQEPETGEAVLADETVPAEAGCMWPLAKSSSLKAEACGEKVVPGFRCCALHAPLVYGKRFTERN